MPALISDNHTPETTAVLLERLERPYLVTDQGALESMGITSGTVARLTERTACVDGVPDGRPDLLDFAALRGAPVPARRLRAYDEPMVITHTSGTTGIPKLVLHSAGSLYSLGLVEAERWPVFGLRADDTVAFCRPCSHQRVVTGLLPLTTVGPKLLMLSDPRNPGLRTLLVRHAPTLVETLPNAFLPEHRHGHGALYGGLNQGRIDVARLRRALVGVPLSRAADGRLVLAVDVSPWLRPAANTCADRSLCHTFGRGEAGLAVVVGYRRHRGRRGPLPAILPPALRPGAHISPVQADTSEAADRGGRRSPWTGPTDGWDRLVVARLGGSGGATHSNDPRRLDPYEVTASRRRRFGRSCRRT